MRKQAFVQIYIQPFLQIMPEIKLYHLQPFIGFRDDAAFPLHNFIGSMLFHTCYSTLKYKIARQASMAPAQVKFQNHHAMRGAIPDDEHLYTTRIIMF